MSRKILVTSALPYANGSIHLGHLVEYIQTDIWVRFQKLRGRRCLFICADDTHGTAIMIRARKEGRSEEQLIAEMTRIITLTDRVRLDLRFRALMQVWLYFHVPLSFALLASLIAHIISVFYFW